MFGAVTKADTEHLDADPTEPSRRWPNRRHRLPARGTRLTRARSFKTARAPSNRAYIAMASITRAGRDPVTVPIPSPGFAPSGLRPSLVSNAGHINLRRGGLLHTLTGEGVAALALGLLRTPCW